ncbi:MULTISPECIES: flagellar hook protein FlgE [Pseudomonas]|uniref:flagellar hook protein FlgE n=1 Tax=Pseudomonas TaxID=286 RepID=UPI0012391638|nr:MULTISPECIES: flagellar hook protein FlgE [Pseudomonas]MBA1250741.1 flagellar hook protein FlgE [Pseudomonas zeshuii]QEU29477.1 flagellar hook protein FlgE [Pseudomonas luteola]
MSFNVGLSGLKAASTHLNVTGNNIANVGSTGFKASRAEFADIYATSMFGVGNNTTGSGVLTANISQQFTQGTISKTGNSLDMAINGNGFYIMSNNGTETYTRNGTFSTDKEGYIVDNSGNRLQGYRADVDGNIVPGAVTDLVVDTTNQLPKATTAVAQTLTLNSSSTVPTSTTFDPNLASSYNWSTSVSVFDTQGNEHNMMQYFVKNDTNQWTMYVTVDGRNPADPTSTTPYSANVNFDAAGRMSSIASNDFQVDANNVLTMNNWVPAAVKDSKADPVVWGANGAAANGAGVTLDITKVTQTNSSSAVTKVTQDGYTTGQLSGLSVDASGTLFANYTNGQSKNIGQTVLATFANMQGLRPVGNTNWIQTVASGEPVRGTPGSGVIGTIESGSLEDSNVDLTAQLVDLIVAQRNYQANAKTIETENAISQTIIQIR